MLLNCVAYEDGQKLADIPVEEISDYMEKPETFVWVALHEASAEELAVMQHEFGLHELAVEDASRGHQRPKIEEYGDSLFVVVKTVECRDGDVVLGEVDIFVGQNYVLSSRDGSSTKGFLGVRARAEREPHMLRKGPAFVLYALMDAIVDRYFPVLEMLETELEKIEELIFSQGKQRDNIERLYELKGKVTTVRHAVVPMMEAVGRLYGGRVPSMCLDTQDYFRDVHDHLHRISAALDTIRDTIATAIQVNLSMTAIEESEVNKRLAAWAAIFAIVTAFAGVWGMNFKAMPELEWKYGYPMALSIMIFVCWILHRRFKRAGWL
ncbi:magnesium transporter [Duganella sp. Leaf126]|uniref:magnesium/cobalt transporter CorA n=1 Tax=Duganella sp. Leaf126 TaxID=1736266 RepID=UPI0006FEB1FE|nr:magnesium/cobalt transporter CorA [Duganella sp. Leaf126]KQQ47123.1 magnesium transporter [Duganella sp. Leaf126]